jgi:hypothetical protein
MVGPGHGSIRAMIKAYISESYAGMGIRVALVEHMGDTGRPLSILRLAPGGDGAAPYWLHDPIDEANAGAEMVPTIVLGHLEARALLDGLLAHYQGSEDSRTLRRDYDWARTRYDKAVDALTVLASRPQQIHVTRATEQP